MDAIRSFSVKEIEPRQTEYTGSAREICSTTKASTCLSRTRRSCAFNDEEQGSKVDDSSDGVFRSKSTLISGAITHWGRWSNIIAWDRHHGIVAWTAGALYRPGPFIVGFPESRRESGHILVVGSPEKRPPRSGHSSILYNRSRQGIITARSFLNLGSAGRRFRDCCERKAVGLTKIQLWSRYYSTTVQWDWRSFRSHCITIILPSPNWLLGSVQNTNTLCSSPGENVFWDYGITIDQELLGYDFRSRWTS